MLAFKLSLVLISLCLLSGCATKNIGATKYITESHIKKDTDNINKNAKFPALNAIIEAGSGVTPQQLLDYQDEGILLTRTHCLDSVRNIANRSTKLSYSKEQFLLSTILATGLMGINGAASSSFEKLALGSAFIIGSTDLFQNYYLLGPNAAEVIGLLENALKKQQEAYEHNNPQNFYDASIRIYNYAMICTNVKINQLVKSSIVKAKLVVPMLASIKTSIKNRIAEIFNVSFVSDTQLAALFYITTNGEEKLTDKYVKKILGDAIKLESGSEKLALIDKVFSTLPEKYKKPISDHWAEYVSIEEKKIIIAEQVELKNISLTFIPQISAVFDNKTVAKVQYGPIFALYKKGKSILDNPLIAKSINNLIVEKDIDVVTTQLNAVFMLVEEGTQPKLVDFLMNPSKKLLLNGININSSPKRIAIGFQTSQIGTVEVSND